MVSYTLVNNNNRLFTASKLFLHPTVSEIENNLSLTFSGPTFNQNQPPLSVLACSMLSHLP